jgi:hypothetical protein
MMVEYCGSPAPSAHFTYDWQHSRQHGRTAGQNMYSQQVYVLLALLFTILTAQVLASLHLNDVWVVVTAVAAESHGPSAGTHKVW